MARKTTPSFILELGLEANAHDEAELNKRFEAARQLYNTCLSEAKRRLDLLRQSKEFQKALLMAKTSGESGCRKPSEAPGVGVLTTAFNGKSNKERTETFKALNAHFGFTEYDLHIYATKIRNSWIGDHIDSTTAQKIATRAFKAVQRIAFGQAKRVRFKGKNQLKSVRKAHQRLRLMVEGKTNTTGIRYLSAVQTGQAGKETGYVEWNGLKLRSIIDVNDEVVVHGLSHRVKYLRIIKRIFNGKTCFFVQLVLEGKPFIKEKNKASDNTVGLDIGPSTIASVSNQQAKLERFCDELKDKQTFRRLQRKLDRQRRANNPQNYNPDGTIKPGKKTWHDSKRYLRTKTKLAELQRKLAAHRKSLHGNLANRIMIQGKHIKTEKLSYRAFQKNYGKSVRKAHQRLRLMVKDRAPSMFMEILRRKAENAGGSVVEFSTRTTKLSQYCHVVCVVLISASISRSIDEHKAHKKCGKYTKRPLSQRWHTCCNLNIQRDLYSAFLAGSVVENPPNPPFCKGGYKLDTADVINNPLPPLVRGTLAEYGSCSPAGGVRIKQPPNPLW